MPSGNVLTLIGNGGHAKSLIETAISMNLDYSEYKLIDYRDIEEFVTNEQQGVKRDIVLAIGSNFKRWEVYKFLNSKLMDLHFPNLIHNSSSVSKSVKFGFGNFVGANTYVGPNAQIGSFTIINTGSIIEHDSEISDFCSIAPGCELGGNVKLGIRSAIGIGSTILQSVNISDDSIVGAKSLLNIDCPNNVVMYGIPAKIIRDRKYDDKYLY